jgi:archaellum component FlaC
MTAKRFILSDFFWEVLDTKYDWLGNTEPFSEEVIEEGDYLLIGEAKTQEDGENICKLLNKVIEENEQLKSDAGYWAKTAEARLKKIEQLKTTIQQLRTDNTKQKKQLNETMKQNKHTTTTIKTMMENERTELGRSVLRQLWEAIQ